MGTSLPNGWLATKLGEVVDYSGATKMSPDLIKDDDWVLGLEDIEKDTSRLIRRAVFSEVKSKSTKTKFSKGDVLYGKLRPYLNKVLIADQDGYCTTEIIPLSASESIDNRFLYYSLRTPLFQDYVNGIIHGLQMPRLGTKAGKNAPLLLPPLPEQKRIADKLDCLLAKVDACKARLDKVPGIIKRFRQSVLADATSGRLTEDWRKQNNIESNWKKYQLDQIAKIIDPQPSHRTPPKVDGGVPYIGIGDLNGNGQFDFESARKVSTDVLQEHQKRYQLQEGDFIFGKIGTLGQATELPMGIEYTLSANVILIQPDKDISVSKYIMYFLQSPETMSEVASQSKSTSQAAFGIKKMRAFQFLLPSIKEQKEIVKRVETLFSIADQMDDKLKRAKKGVDKLTASTLAKAFRGELVPQDPNDEPAEKLLEKIQIKTI